MHIWTNIQILLPIFILYQSADKIDGYKRGKLDQAAESWGVSVAVECVADTYLPLSECKPKAKKLSLQSKTKENRLVPEHEYSKIVNMQTFSKGKRQPETKHWERVAEEQGFG